jgi:hypothetical protein
MNEGRVLGAATAAAGAVLATGGPAAGEWVSGRDAPPPGWLVRALGARVLTQGVLLMVRPGRRLVLAGATVDATHAASMVAAAVKWPQYRRAAVVSAGVAVGFAVAGLAVARR